MDFKGGAAGGTVATIDLHLMMQLISTRLAEGPYWS